ncbi:MAG: hypothetical protein IPM54_18715 [Polyangiaceae bacterium]|nr:hypothetical protein [Polyangiaceae bacterium]
MRILVCTLAVATASVGCAKDGSPTRKELSAIQQELVRMRAENAILMARVEALETTRTPKAAPESAPKAAVSADEDRPKLDVLRLTPTPETSPQADKPAASKDETSTASEVDQDEPRPVLRSTGRGEVVAQSPRTSKPPVQPRPAKTGSGTPR